MRFLTHILLASVLAIIIGFGLSFYALTDGRIFATYSSGPWRAWPEAGVANPDPYTNAYLSRRGALQLGASEGIEFIADTDSDGEALLLECTYRIEGNLPLAAFWTLVGLSVEGANLAKSPDSQFIDSDHIAREADGSIMVRVSTQLSSGNWLELKGAGPYQLVLRLYDSNFRETTNTRGNAMPTIAREACL